MFQKRKDRNGQKGAAMIEAAITMPIILGLLMITYDVGSALNSAFRMQDFARLGLSHLSSQLDLDSGTFVSDRTGCRMTRPTFGSCPTSSLDHQVVHAKIRDLIIRAGDIPINRNSIEVETKFETIVLTSGTPTDIISINIRGNYTGLFFPFNNLPISLAETGPRL